MKHAIGIDLGGTKTESILLAPDGDCPVAAAQAHPQGGRYDAMLALVVEMIRESAEQLPADTPYTTGIGIPGSIDAATGMVRNAVRQDQIWRRACVRYQMQLVVIKF